MALLAGIVTIAVAGAQKSAPSPSPEAPSVVDR
jgi:hypothetical protein